MKKFLSLIIVSVLACFFISGIIACAPNGGGIELPVKFGANLLKDCFVEVYYSDNSLAVELKTKESVATNNKGYLVCFDENNQLRQVKFLYEHINTTQTVDGEDNVITEEIEITQEEIEASVSNLYVTKKFTYITFTKIGYDGNYYGERFTANSFFGCDEYNQSFIIDNETHKLYPTNEIGAFTKIRENFVSVNEKFYELTIDVYGNLTSRKIVPNDNIIEQDVIVDKFGQVFVLNSSANEVRDNFVYYTSGTSSKLLGDNGLVYNIQGNSIKYYDQNLELKVLPDNITVSFDGYLIKNNTLFYLHSPEWHDDGFDEWLYHCKISDGTTLGGEYTYTYGSNNFGIVGIEIFEYHYVNGTKTLFYYDTNTKTWEEEITTFTNIKISGSSLILTKETIDGTKKYEITVSNGVVLPKLLVDITYKNEIITIQPLN